MTNEYGKTNWGSFVDNDGGVDAIVAFATKHGFSANLSGCDCESPRVDHRGPGDCGFFAEIEDEATEYMNEEYPAVGYSWRRHSNREWGLYPV